MSLLQVKTPFNIELQFQTAPFHVRMGAWLIDGVILTLFSKGMSALLESTMGAEAAQEFGFEELLHTVPYILYHLLWELFNKGQSLGKMALNIRVISMEGTPATASQYVLRWMLRFIDFGFILGWLLMIIYKQFMFGGILMVGSLISFILFISSTHNQRLGDLVANTTVVLKKLPYSISDTIFQNLDTQSYRVNFEAVMRLSDKDINIIDNVVKQHNKSDISNYVSTVAQKIKTVLQIESDMPDDMFLETLLRDYNYLSRK